MFLHFYDPTYELDFDNPKKLLRAVLYKYRLRLNKPFKLYCLHTSITKRRDLKQYTRRQLCRDAGEAVIFLNVMNPT